MKKLLVTFLGIAFLLPALASAGSYCVTLPDGSKSLWSGRDNVVGVRFRYDYNADRYADKRFRLTLDPGFFASSGTTDGSSGTNHILKKLNYTRTKQYNYYNLNSREPRELCVYDPAPDFGRVKYIFHTIVGDRTWHALYNVKINELRADVSFGENCKKVTIKNNLIVGNHKFEIYRRSGNHTNPWGCRKK